MGATDQERKKLTLLEIFHLLNVFLRELSPREMTVRIINNYSSSPNGLWVFMGYWLRGHEGKSNNCFSKIQLVGQKYRE